MLRMRRIVKVDKRLVLCVAVVLFVFIVVDRNTGVHRQAYMTKPIEKTSIFAIFLVVPSDNDLLERGNFINRYFKLANCDAIKSFHLYLLRYVDEQALIVNQSVMSSLNESFKQCRRHIPIVVDDFLIKDPTMDGWFVRDLILGAYLDSVDYYYIAFPDGIAKKSKARLDGSPWRDILLRRSLFGVGVVATLNPKESESVSKLFFSKIHIEIFGAAFPVTISKLETALSYIVELYSYNRLATISNGEKITAEAKRVLGGEITISNWTEQLTEDTITLNRLGGHRYSG